jgi:magnesium transporter
MAKFTRRYNKKRIGLPPGSTDHIPVGVSGISAYSYNETELNKKLKLDISDIQKFLLPGYVSWINVNGLDSLAIENIGKLFKVHSLFIEDILHVGQRPKLEEREDYFYLVLNMLDFDEAKSEVKSEQVSFIFNNDFLISFQEKEGDVFDPVRFRIEQSKGRIRKHGADYLVYCLIDVIVDRFFVILEQLGNNIEALENQVLEDPSIDLLQEINHMKREFIFLRKNIWPLREVINSLHKSEAEIIHPNTRFYVKDVYDHTIQIMDSIDTYREMLSGILDIYMSSVSNRLNKVMKTLTIIATIFIPLTFLVGVYGMNFNYMPELEWKYGYFIIWGIMISSAVSLLVYFKKKEWL